MKPVYFIPGPSQLYPSVPKHINEALELGIPSWSHRSEDFRSIFRNTAQKVKQVMNAPESTHIFFLGSGTEGMECIVQNVVEKKSFHFVNGSFSKRLHKTSSQLGKHPEKFDAEPGRPFRFGDAKIPGDAELLCFTHNETSMGLRTRMEDITGVAEQHPDALVAVDVVSSAPCVDVNWDVVDCAFFSVQKCFGLPAGLGVLMVNDAAIGKSRQLQQKGVSIGSYHSFPSMLDEEVKSQTPETPNVLAIYLLGKVCEDFLHQGIGRIQKDATEKAAMMYGFFDNHPVYKPFIEDKGSRSETVIVAQTPQGSKHIISALKQKGLIIGSGYAEYKDAHMRIANFPAHRKEDLQRVIEGISNLP